MTVCESDLELELFHGPNPRKAPTASPSASQREGNRREHRFPSSDPAKMQVLSRTGVANLECRIVDISRHGMKLDVPNFVQPGTIVRVQVKEAMVVLGEVRYCVKVEETFQIGILIEDVLG